LCIDIKLFIHSLPLSYPAQHVSEADSLSGMLRRQPDAHDAHVSAAAGVGGTCPPEPLLQSSAAPGAPCDETPRSAATASRSAAAAQCGVSMQAPRALPPPLPALPHLRQHR